MASYLFIDAGYLHETYNDTMKAYFDEVPPIDYPHLVKNFGSFQKVYYYDAVDRNPVKGETPEQAAARVKTHDDFHAFLNSLPLWHVREGFVSR